MDWSDLPPGAKKWVLEAIESFAETNEGAARDLKNANRAPADVALFGQRAAGWRSALKLLSGRAR